ncbi:MAG: hypothetical protein JWR27_566 [Aeromicrobium sp.]|jgi:hypothetical protein|nr:hypothetical protein [Aeromicrobium sp.]
MYTFLSRWTMASNRDDLWDALEALLATDDPMVWWPSVQVTAYDGNTMRLRAASGLGYAVTFTLSELDVARPDQMTFVATGDLRGSGVVTFVDLGTGRSAMDIDWRVATDRRWMQRTGWLLRPVFTLGHHLVMRRGERHFARWLASH